MVEIDPYNLKVIADRFFGTNDRNLDAFGQDAQARMMGALVDAIPAGDLVKIETVTNRVPGEQGYRRPIGDIDPEPMKNLAIIIDHVGGTRNGFNRAAIRTGPDDGAPGYTLLGWGHAGDGHGAERPSESTAPAAIRSSAGYCHATASTGSSPCRPRPLARCPTSCSRK